MLGDKIRVTQGLCSLGVFIKQPVSLSQRLLRHLVLRTKHVPGKHSDRGIDLAYHFMQEVTSIDRGHSVSSNR